MTAPQRASPQTNPSHVTLNLNFMSTSGDGVTNVGYNVETYLFVLFFVHMSPGLARFQQIHSKRPKTPKERIYGINEIMCIILRAKQPLKTIRFCILSLTDRCFTFERLRQAVGQYMITAETSNPQFQIATSVLCQASCLLSIVSLIIHTQIVIRYFL